MENPALKLDDQDIEGLMSRYPDHPPVTDDIVRTFSNKKGGMRADTIKAPAKLYRIVDPSNEGAGIFWISEAEFKALKDISLYTSLTPLPT